MIHVNKQNGPGVFLLRNQCDPKDMTIWGLSNISWIILTLLVFLGFEGQTAQIPTKSLMAHRRHKVILQSQAQTNDLETILNQYIQIREKVGQNSAAQFSRIYSEQSGKVAGGWNGSGGGGGYACFKNKQTLLDSLDELGYLKKDSYESIESFELLDLYEMHTPPEWTQQPPREFILRQIRTRIAPLFPIFAQEILEELKHVEKSQFFQVSGAEPFRDLGSQDLLKESPENCAHVTWILRLQDNSSHLPFTLYNTNLKLENRLKILLSPEDFERKRAVVYLYEAI